MSYLNVVYDEFLKCCENSWKVKIDGEYHYFPYSFCTLDDISNVILCPEWFVIDSGLEQYIDD